MLVLFSLLATFILSLYIYLTRNFSYWKKRGVAGPTPFPYVGTYPKTFYYRTSNLIQETTEIYWKYFRKHRFVGVFESVEPKLLILDPALITDVYVKYFKNFSDNTLRETVNFTIKLLNLLTFVTLNIRYIIFCLLFSDNFKKRSFVKSSSIFTEW